MNRKQSSEKGTNKEVFIIGDWSFLNNPTKLSEEFIKEFKSEIDFEKIHFPNLIS